MAPGLSACLEVVDIVSTTKLITLVVTSVSDNRVPSSEKMIFPSYPPAGASAAALARGGLTSCHVRYAAIILLQNVTYVTTLNYRHNDTPFRYCLTAGEKM